MLRILTVTALLALSITAAQAEDASNASTLVSYADLDLSQPVDARTLAARLQDAATAVCLKANPDNLGATALESCVDMSVHLAMARIESDMDQAVRYKLSNVRTAMRD